MHYYQFNIGDYSSHTKGLSLIEDLAYRRLIDEYYLAEHAFNGCSADVARLIGLRDNLQEVEYVLNRYFTKDGDSWNHGRIDSDIADYHQKQEKRSNAGKKSAEARQKSTYVEQVLNECSANVELTNNHKPITINQEPIINNYPSDSVPLQKIVELFNESFPELPKVKQLTDKRKTAIRRRWLENTDMQDLERWHKFFAYVRLSDFLMGRTVNPWNGFCFDWLFTSSNFVKIREGNYHK
jgi:uncharacterized protein YdaU (DUF1376 family)